MCGCMWAAQQVAEWKERVITHCLYGVDINPEAVEICRLRLWLSMVVDAERPVPLPNLDFRSKWETASLTT